MKWLGRLLVTSLTILSVPYFVSGVQVDGVGTALLAALVLGILNVTLKPILILLTLPFTLVTLGLFLLVVNAIVFQFAAGLLPGLHVASFGSAFLAALLVSLVSWILQINVRKEGNRRVFVVRDTPTGSSRKIRDIN
jgi:putative membrane protein